MDNLVIKSAVVIAALAALPTNSEAQNVETKVVTKKTQQVSEAAKVQLGKKATTTVDKDAGAYVKDGWFKVNKPADKSRPIEKINVQKAASKVKQ